MIYFLCFLTLRISNLVDEKWYYERETSRAKGSGQFSCGGRERVKERERESERERVRETERERLRERAKERERARERERDKENKTLN